MNARLTLKFGAMLLMAGGVGCDMDRNNNGLDDDDDEITMQLSDMPAPVRTAILNLTPESSITQLSRETENGQTVYEVEYTANGQETEAEFNAQGQIIEEGDDEDPDEDEDDDD